MEPWWDGLPGQLLFSCARGFPAGPFTAALQLPTATAFFNVDLVGLLFKLKTNAPEHYSASPAMGLIAPENAKLSEVLVTFVGDGGRPHDCAGHKFELAIAPISIYDVHELERLHDRSLNAALLSEPMLRQLWALPSVQTNCGKRTLSVAFAHHDDTPSTAKDVGFSLHPDLLFPSDSSDTSPHQLQSNKELHIDSDDVGGSRSNRVCLIGDGADDPEAEGICALVSSLVPPPFSWSDGPIIGRGAFGIVRLGVVTATPVTQRSNESAASANVAGGSSPRTTGYMITLAQYQMQQLQPDGSDDASQSVPASPISSGCVRMGQAIAVKEVPLTSTESWPAVCREAAALAALSGCAGVIRLLGLMRLPPDVSSPLDRAVILMSLAPGGNLSRIASQCAMERVVPTASAAANNTSAANAATSSRRLRTTTTSSSSFYGSAESSCALDQSCSGSDLFRAEIPGRGGAAAVSSASRSSDGDATGAGIGSSSSSSSAEGQAYSQRDSVMAMPAQHASCYIRQLLESLEAVHSSGIAHRDIKGSNLLLTSPHRTGSQSAASSVDVVGAGGCTAQLSDCASQLLLADFGSALLGRRGQRLAAALSEAATTVAAAAAAAATTGRTFTSGPSNSSAAVNGNTSTDAAAEHHRDGGAAKRGGQGTLQWCAPEVVTGGLGLGNSVGVGRGGGRNNGRAHTNMSVIERRGEATTPAGSNSTTHRPRRGATYGVPQSLAQQLSESLDRSREGSSGSGSSGSSSCSPERRTGSSSDVDDDSNQLPQASHPSDSDDGNDDEYAAHSRLLAHWQAADVWSVGCTVLELLTGRPPWFGLAEDSAEVMLHIAAVDLRSALPSWIGGPARDFVCACLHPDPASRPFAAQLLRHPFIMGAANSPPLFKLKPSSTPAVAATSHSALSLRKQLRSAERAAARTLSLCRLACKLVGRTCAKVQLQLSSSGASTVAAARKQKQELDRSVADSFRMTTADPFAVIHYLEQTLPPAPQQQQQQQQQASQHVALKSSAASSALAAAPQSGGATDFVVTAVLQQLRASHPLLTASVPAVFNDRRAVNDSDSAQLSVFIACTLPLAQHGHLIRRTIDDDDSSGMRTLLFALLEARLRMHTNSSIGVPDSARLSSADAPSGVLLQSLPPGVPVMTSAHSGDSSSPAALLMLSAWLGRARKRRGAGEGAQPDVSDPGLATAATFLSSSYASVWEASVLLRATRVLLSASSQPSSDGGSEPASSSPLDREVSLASSALSLSKRVLAQARSLHALIALSRTGARSSRSERALSDSGSESDSSDDSSDSSGSDGDRDAGLEATTAPCADPYKPLQPAEDSASKLNPLDSLFISIAEFRHPAAEADETTRLTAASRLQRSLLHMRDSDSAGSDVGGGYLPFPTGALLLVSLRDPSGWWFARLLHRDELCTGLFGGSATAAAAEAELASGGAGSGWVPSSYLFPLSW